FLRQVEGFVVVAQQVERELVNHPLVLVHKVGAGVLVVRGAALDQQRLPVAHFRPGDGSNRLHGETFRHLTTRQQKRVLLPSPLRTRGGRKCSGGGVVWGAAANPASAAPVLVRCRRETAPAGPAPAGGQPDGCVRVLRDPARGQLPPADRPGRGGLGARQHVSRH